MNKVQKIAKTTGNVLLYVVVGVAVLLLVFYAFAGTGRSLPGGIRPMIVLSGSMEPELPVGSVIVARGVDTKSVKEGDVITFLRTEGADPNTSILVTHRVEQVVNDGGSLRFVTKGDANGTPDGTPVLANQVVGRVFLVVPYAGHITRFVRSALGLVLFILLPALALIGMEVRSLLKRRSKPLQGGGVLILVFALVAAGSVLLGQSSATSAYFSARDNLPAEFSAGTWQQPQATLSFIPGKAKAVRPSEMPPGPACFPIASIDEETKEMKLDFGELHPGNTNNSPDVFRIKNEGDDPVEINVVGAEGFEDFIVRVGQGSHRLPVTLDPGEEYSIDIKLGIPHNADPGDYRGVVRVIVTGVSTMYNIPALVTVVDSGKGPKKSEGSEDKKLGEGSSLSAPGAEGTEGEGGGTTTTTLPGASSGQQDQSTGDSTGDQGSTTSSTAGNPPDGQLPLESQGSPPAQN